MRGAGKLCPLCMILVSQDKTEITWRVVKTQVPWGILILLPPIDS